MATRYRCTACGNLTRFDVTTSRRTRAFHHFTVGGELTVEDEEILDERVEEVVAGKRHIADLVLPKSSSLADLDADQLRVALGLRTDTLLTEDDE